MTIGELKGDVELGYEKGRASGSSRCERERERGRRGMLWRSAVGGICDHVGAVE